MQCARFNVDRAYTHVRRALMIMENAMTIVQHTGGADAGHYEAHVDARRCIHGVTTEKRWAITWRNGDYASHVYTMWHPVGATEHDVIQAWYRI